MRLQTKAASQLRFSPWKHLNVCPLEILPTIDPWNSWLATRAERFLLFARDQTRCEADGHDVFQEALVESWRRGGDAPPADALVFATIRRRAIDLARRNQRRELREVQAHGWFEDSASVAGQNPELEEAVKSLPPDLREVLILKTWGELTFKQIGETLNVPLNTAASRYRYALDHLRLTMKEVRS